MLKLSYDLNTLMHVVYSCNRYAFITYDQMLTQMFCSYKNGVLLLLSTTYWPSIHLPTYTYFKAVYRERNLSKLREIFQNDIFLTHWSLTAHFVMWTARVSRESWVCENVEHGRKCIWQLAKLAFFKYSPKIYFSSYSQLFLTLCTKHSQESSYELVIESEHQLLTGGCVKHYFSVSDKLDLLYINHFWRYEVAFEHGNML